MTEIPYEELWAAHREAIAQRDLARDVAVALEQELDEAYRGLREITWQLQSALLAASSGSLT